MFDTHEAKELRTPRGDLVPGSHVVHVLDASSYGIAIGVHGSIVDVLWTRAPMEDRIMRTKVAIACQVPIEYITLTLKVDGDGEPDDVA